MACAAAENRYRGAGMKASVIKQEGDLQVSGHTVRAPPTIPINHYFSPEHQQIEPKSFIIIPC